MPYLSRRQLIGLFAVFQGDRGDRHAGREHRTNRAQQEAALGKIRVMTIDVVEGKAPWRIGFSM